MQLCAAQLISPNLAPTCVASIAVRDRIKSNKIKYKSIGDSDKHGVYFCNCRHSVSVVDRTRCVRVPVAFQYQSMTLQNVRTPTAYLVL